MPVNTTSCPNESTGLELIFLGTGTSSSTPHVDCLTADLTKRPPCKACLSTFTPEGKKNIRRNTGAAVRMKAKDGRSVTVVIDAGKTFQAAAIEWFPKFGLRRIDALLITHAHADAMNGLDDLRAWTLRKAIQPHIDVYLSQETFTELQRSFPYLVSKEFASGGGDVPDFKYHIINDSEPFEIENTGISITPFAVHHGRIFSKLPPVAYTITPTATLPSTPEKSDIKALEPEEKKSGVGVAKEQPEAIIHPLLCFGFKIQEQLVYISDVSHIPDHVWDILQRKEGNSGQPLPVLVLDCLRLRPFISHFGIADAVMVAKKIGATRTYLTGFSHEVSHEEYVTITEAVGGKLKSESDLTESEKTGLELVQGEGQLWVRPAHDGLSTEVGLDTEGDYRVIAPNMVVECDGAELYWTPTGASKASPTDRPPLPFNLLSKSFQKLKEVAPYFATTASAIPERGSLLMKFFSQSFLYDDPWPIVSLAYFLRYPNPYAAHVISCDVISRFQTASGTLVTTRLILKRGNLPRWFPQGMMSRAESWVIEESEVDPFGRIVNCRTRNLDHVKIMRVEESVQFRQTPEGKTLQATEARIFSGFGWGLTKKIENHGLTRFKANLQRSREGVSLILDLIRQSRLQPMTLGGEPYPFSHLTGQDHRHTVPQSPPSGVWGKLKSWFRPPSS